MAGDRSIRLRQVSKTFTTRGESFTALDSVSLDCEAGSFTALIGPSGCGKSTLLRLALGLDKPDSGTAEIGGLAAEGRRLHRHHGRCLSGRGPAALAQCGGEHRPSARRAGQVARRICAGASRS